jgi:hypothetical protein
MRRIARIAAEENAETPYRTRRFHWYKWATLTLTLIVSGRDFSPGGVKFKTQKRL